MKPGDHVHVASFGKGVVREVRNRGRVLVEVKGRAMVVDAVQLTPSSPPRHSATRYAGAGSEAPPAHPRRTARLFIDLHGMTVIEATAALDEFMNDAMLAGVEQVEVIHGRSGRRLRDAVHARLRELPSVRGFRVDRRNPGVTQVVL